MNKQYEEAVAFIHSRRKFTKDPSLNKMRTMMDLLGNPEKKLKMVHITGTNGKGSVTADLRDLLRACHFTVGTFTSPFIERFNERIAINGQMISDQELVQLVQQIKPVVLELDQKLGPKEGPKEFEVLTAMMLVYFAKKKVDYVLVEVGIGGTFDSTNIIDPLLSVITTVAMDHAKILGPTLTDVAQNKAGIIKDWRPVVLGRLPKEALTVILAKAQKTQSRVYTFGQDYQARFSQSQADGEIFSYRFENKHLGEFKTGLKGIFQVDNAACALTALLVLGRLEHFEIDLELCRQGLAKTFWPARFEKLAEKPLLVVDGAHNPAAVAVLKETLNIDYAKQKIVVILGILADKDAAKMVEILLTIPNVTLILTTFNGPRQVISPGKLHARYSQTLFYDDWHDALKVAQKKQPELILMAGSLYFISEVRSEILGAEDEN
ncbi:dihydrofolate synthase / folylpolyglutamate synthase [Ligilactobacillus sp. WC1T17]|uniref:tetrahydrofolate synthase n=1 Tax=Ligilactobacillus ruminis TaxID=1623 RepID=A0ABY1AAT7_9LACO|nr:dihydrofolate synthase / folylpolyglutamate synthase [Ligilactobacillus ruminis]